MTTVDLHVERVTRTTEPHVMLDGVSVWLGETEAGATCVDVWSIGAVRYQSGVVDEAGAQVAVLAAVWEMLVRDHPDEAEAWMRARVADLAGA